MIALGVDAIPDYHSGFPYIIPINASGHGLGTDRAKGWFTAVVFAHRIAPYDLKHKV